MSTARRPQAGRLAQEAVAAGSVRGAGAPHRTDEPSPVPARGPTASWRTALRDAFAFILGVVCLCLPCANLLVVGWGLDRMARLSQTGDSRSRLDSRLGSVPVYLWLGSIAALGSFVILGTPMFLLYAAWIGGWIMSFERASLDYSWWPFAGFTVATLLLAPLQGFLPLALVHFARERKARALFDVRYVVGLMVRAPWRVVGCAAFVPLFSLLRCVYNAGFYVDAGGPGYAERGLWVFPGSNALALMLCLVTWSAWAGCFRRCERVGPATVGRGHLALMLLVFPAALTNALTLASSFTASHGASDFFVSPAFMVPSVPHPLGELLVGRQPQPQPGHGP